MSWRYFIAWKRGRGSYWYVTSFKSDWLNYVVWEIFLLPGRRDYWYVKPFENIDFINRAIILIFLCHNWREDIIPHTLKVTHLICWNQSITFTFIYKSREYLLSWVVNYYLKKDNTFALSVGTMPNLSWHVLYMSNTGCLNTDWSFNTYC